jgi:hypothetical protein
VSASRVEVGQLAQAALYLGEYGQAVALHLGQGVDGVLGALYQLGGIGQAGVALVEAGPFVLLQAQLGQFVDLPGEPFAFHFGFARQLVGIAACLAGGLPFLPGLMHFAGQRAAAGIGIQQFALGFGFYQRLVGVLAVDVDQKLAQQLELGQRGRLAVDEAARAAGFVQYAADQHDVVVAGQGVFLQPGLDFRALAAVEFGADFGARRLRAPASLRRGRPATGRGHPAEWICQPRFRRSVR